MNWSLINDKSSNGRIIMDSKPWMIQIHFFEFPPDQSIDRNKSNLIYWSTKVFERKLYAIVECFFSEWKSYNENCFSLFNEVTLSVLDPLKDSIAITIF